MADRVKRVKLFKLLAVLGIIGLVSLYWSMTRLYNRYTFAETESWNGINLTTIEGNSSSQLSSAESKSTKSIKKFKEVSEEVDGGGSNYYESEKDSYDDSEENDERDEEAKESQTFDQMLDHFNTSSDSKWLQRYWVNSWYFNGSGPVFLYIGGESEESGSDIFDDTLVTQLARETGALMVALEHRYYGKSRPTPDASERNLRFLSVDQAIADLVAFRDFIHSSYNLTAKNKWVAIGGSYPGVLSALLRLRRPDKIHAALASSAPLHLGIEYRGYFQIVNSVINTSYSECASVLGQAMATFNSLLESQEGRAKLRAIFKNQIKSRSLKLDKAIFSLTARILYYWGNVVQHHSLSKSKLENSCSAMIDNSLGEPIQRLANIIVGASDINGTEKSDMTNQTDWDSIEMNSYDRPWKYQTCVELGLMQTTGSSDQPLGTDLNLRYYIDQCRELFGETFSEQMLKNAIERRNQELGSDRYRGTRVVFVNGDQDPWSGAALMKNSSVSPHSKVIEIEGASHCSDFVGYQKGNPPQINIAVHEIKAQLQEYILE